MIVLGGLLAFADIRGKIDSLQAIEDLHIPMCLSRLCETMLNEDAEYLTRFVRMLRMCGSLLL
jgi:hypothetical protein